jgi:methyltransferase (TIGR00027 family)
MVYREMKNEDNPLSGGMMCIMDTLPFISKEPASPGGQETRRSRLAEEVALHRVAESFLPEDVRVCYDPYAIRFLGNDLKKYLEFCKKNPDAARRQAEQVNRQFPGVRNAIIARVRYFDDVVSEAVTNGLEQLVILGSGYDTRAHRIAGLDTNVRVFEVDHPDTQDRKKAKIRENFGELPRHIVYVPVDFESDDLARQLTRAGYQRSKKTLFVLEGVVYYITESAVRATLSYIARNSGRGSAVLFDYLPESVVSGTNPQEVARNMRARAVEYGEPFRFGIREGSIRAFLEDQGFSQVHSVTCTELKARYFHGKNAGRELCDLFAFATAEVPGSGGGAASVSQSNRGC